ncbi:MAG: LptF/LptG family permease [Bacteroidaceae bacterium]|nr:LptF/LptG family permease [Bacteroidaceae bacterium]MBQ6225022.1 LptF/LptG family permease [Bacteroidaceae bacterium]
MKRIDRYIIAKFLGTYFFSIVLIISIGVVFDYNENIDRFTESQAPWKAIIMQYYLNFIPYYANLFSALFVFISVIFFTTKLADRSEIIAMISAGISRRRLLMPYMISAAIIAGMTFYLGAEVIPRSSVKRLAFENTYKKRVKNPTYAEKVQLQVDTGVIAYMEHFDGMSKTGMHFSLDKFENKKLVSHLSANTAIYDTLSDVRYQWHLRDVTIRELRGMREKITNYNQIDSIIRMEPRDFLFIRNQQETMTNAELKDYIEKQRNRGSGNLSIFEVEYYKRFASPFAAFILSTIGMSLSSRKRKGGMGFSLGIGIALSATYILLQGISATFSTNAGMHPALAAWMPNILYSLIAIYLYRKAPQ